MNAWLDRAAWRNRASACCLLLALTACGGAGGGGGGGSSNGGSNSGSGPVSTVTVNNLPGSGESAPAAATTDNQPSSSDAARFLTQSTFGIRSTDEIEALRKKGYPLWIWEQINGGTTLHTSYLDQQRAREEDGRATEEMSYEAIWQQWLYGGDQLRARVAFALAEIVVISNIAPDLRPYAMSSYWDMLNRNAFGNYRTVLKDVTLHPAMGYYLNMVNSEKENTRTGAHPNENYAREVLQLFSIGLVKLNIDGTPQLDSSGKPIPTYDETVVQGFAKAFTGWTFPNAKSWGNADENADAAWISPMKSYPAYHANDSKILLNGTVLPAGQTPAKDLDDAIDNIFNHPNVGPFISRELIQRLVTSNPGKDYIARVATVFNDNGSGVRGDLRAVVRAILLDAEARNATPPNNFGKQREPVIRFANMLRALNAKSTSGRNAIHYLDGDLGQSPLLSPSVFNFFSPNYRAPGAIARAGLYSPEFQITTETTVVGSLNFFADLFNSGGYGWGDTQLKLDTTALEAQASTPATLADTLNALFCNYQMSSTMRTRLINMLSAMPSRRSERVKAALILVSLSPDFVVQR